MGVSGFTGSTKRHRRPIAAIGPLASTALRSKERMRTMVKVAERPGAKRGPTGEVTSPEQPANGDTTPSPASSDTLQSFTLDDLAQYTKEGAFGPTASPDFRVFYVGRDDVHGVLVHLFSRARLSVKMNMFGSDDDPLHQILIGLVQ